MVMRRETSKFPATVPVWMAAKIVPQRPAVPAPKTKASSLSLLTGMLIASAASGSSRRALQARPVRELLTKCGARDGDGNRRFGLPVDAVVTRREQGIRVGAEAVEGDVAEVEQPREADDDVEAERQDRIEQRVQPVGEQISLVHPERQRRRHGNKEQ